LNYNTPGGKLNRGLSVVDTYQILIGKPLEDDIYMKASILGWSVELVKPKVYSRNADMKSYKHIS
jgi:farnesyl diphosphate synthase